MKERLFILYLSTVLFFCSSLSITPFFVAEASQGQEILLNGITFDIPKKWAVVSGDKAKELAQESVTKDDASEQKIAESTHFYAFWEDKKYSSKENPLASLTYTGHYKKGLTQEVFRDMSAENVTQLLDNTHAVYKEDWQKTLSTDKQNEHNTFEWLGGKKVLLNNTIDAIEFQFKLTVFDGDSVQSLKYKGYTFLYNNYSHLFMFFYDGKNAEAESSLAYIISSIQLEESFAENNSHISLALFIFLISCCFLLVALLKKRRRKRLAGGV